MLFIFIELCMMPFQQFTKTLVRLGKLLRKNEQLSGNIIDNCGDFFKMHRRITIETDGNKAPTI